MNKGRSRRRCASGDVEGESGKPVRSAGADEKGEDAPSRLFLFFSIIPVQLLASMLSGIGFSLDSVAFLMSGLVLFLCWFALLFLMTLPQAEQRLSPRRNGLRKAAIIISTILIVGGIGEGAMVVALHQNLVSTGGLTPTQKKVADTLEEYGYVYTDATALSAQAVEHLLHGDNPYSHPSVIEALAGSEDSYKRVTPLRRGALAGLFPYPKPAQLRAVWDRAVANGDMAPKEFESKFNYPAGTFLLPAPFRAIGIGDLRITFAIIVMLGIIFTAFFLPRATRGWFLLAFFASLEISSSVASGETGSLVFPFLLAAWVLAPRRMWLSTLFMAIAVSTKQTAWFYLPFYLILVFTAHGPRQLLRAVGIMVAVGLAMNLPFFIPAPRHWLSSIFAPMLDPMFPMGVGVVTLVTSGVLNIRTSLPFTVMEAAAFAGGIVWYARNCRRFPHVGPLLAIVPLFFAWRSMWPYFYYADIVMLASILIGPDAYPLRRSLSSSPMVSSNSS